MPQDITPHFVASIEPRLIVQEMPHGFTLDPGGPREVGQRSPKTVLIRQFALFAMALLIITFITSGPQTVYKSIPLAVILTLLLTRLMWIIGRDISIGPAKLIVDTWPLCLGSSTRIQLRQPTRIMRVSHIKASLHCSEITSAPDYKGRIFPSETIIWKQDLPTITLAGHSGEVIAAWAITIPPKLPPSFDGAYNVIAWCVVIELVNDLFPNTRCNFLLHVIPEVHADAISSDQ